MNDEERDVVVICVNDGTSCIFSSAEQAMHFGWNVHRERIDVGAAYDGECPSCIEDRDSIYV